MTVGELTIQAALHDERSPAGPIARTLTSERYLSLPEQSRQLIAALDNAAPSPLSVSWLVSEIAVADILDLNHWALRAKLVALRSAGVIEFAFMPAGLVIWPRCHRDRVLLLGPPHDQVTRDIDATAEAFSA